MNPLSGTNKKSFVIRAKNNNPLNRYIQSARLNGRPLTTTWLTHDTLTAGGVLEFEMGSQPNTNWGAAADDVPPNDFP